MRIAVGSINQETNSFSPLKTSLKDFKKNYLFVENDILVHMRNTSTEIGGFITRLEEEGFQPFPTIATQAVSSGPLTEETYEFLCNRLLTEISQLSNIDGILLALHGAMLAEKHTDASGELLQKIRERMGEKIPIVVTLDLHANVTNLMVESSDALTAYHTFPHVDSYNTGYRAANILISMIRGYTRPLMAFKKLPMIVPGENAQTTDGPMAKIMEEIQKIEKEEKILSASVFQVQAWLDIIDTGCSVIVVSDNDSALARGKVEELANLFWKLRYDFLDFNFFSVEEAINRALRIKEKPVILADSADGTGSGSPGDSTAILEALLKMEVKETVLLTLVDPEAVEKAIEAGVGQTITLSVGGKIDNIYHHPVEVTGRIKLMSDGIFRFKGPQFTNLEHCMGQTVVLVVNGNINIVLTEKSAFTFDPQLYRSVGLEPREAKIVVVKSPTGFRASYKEIAKEMLIVDAPGVSSANFCSMPYKNIRRPMFPFDKFDDVNK